MALKYLQQRVKFFKYILYTTLVISFAVMIPVSPFIDTSLTARALYAVVLYVLLLNIIILSTILGVLVIKNLPKRNVDSYRFFVKKVC